jgi:hypothetical protein
VLAEPARAYQSGNQGVSAIAHGKETMIRPSWKETKEIFLDFFQDINDEKRYRFMDFGNGGRYTDKQKNYAFELISKSGVRATARILKTPRRTLQRWCRKHYIYVKRCPGWVYDWTERRRKRQFFWMCRGYF